MVAMMTCSACGQPIVTMCFRGTGFCSALCEKAGKRTPAKKTPRRVATRVAKRDTAS